MPMYNAFVWSFDAISSVLKALAPVATAIIAFAASKNWGRQDKAKREAEFLDPMIEAVHAYIAEMATPITVLGSAKIAMKSHVQSWESDDEVANAVKGAIAYIEKHGEDDAKRLRDLLEALRPSVIKLRSLAAKRQVFGFVDYAKCHNAIVRLTWNFDKIEGFAAAIGSTTWNWLHPDVLERLKAEIAFDPDGIGKSLVRTTSLSSNLPLIPTSASTAPVVL
jgi:hypothetical protein